MENKTINNNVKAWIYGLISSKICTLKTFRTGTNVHIKISVPVRKLDLLEKIVSYFEFPLEIKRGKLKDLDIYYVQFLLDKIKYLGIETHNVGEDSDFNELFLMQYNRDYLRGLFEGNGYINNAKRTFVVTFIHKRESVCKDFAYAISKHLNLNFKVPAYDLKSGSWKIKYTTREARIILWYIYHGDVERMSSILYRHFYSMIVNLSYNPPNQLFQVIFGKDLSTSPKYDNDGLYIPISINSNNDSLNLCKSISKTFAMYNIDVRPVVKNKGKNKYYVPYFPNKYISSINMLRPFLKKEGKV